MGENKESKTAEITPRERRCIICGNMIPVGNSIYCSEECHVENERRRDRERRSWRENRSGIYRYFACADCGKTVYGHIKSTRCKECQAARDRITAAQSRERKKRGHTRKLGSIDLCQHCGKPYVVNGGAQKYCKACAEFAVKQNISKKKREQGKDPEIRTRKRENRREDAKHYKHIGICAYCGKEFTRTKERRLLCSDECKQKSAAARIKRYAHRTSEMQTCIVCGKKFWRDKHHRTLCSDECRAIRERELRSKK